ncbi:MAG TPA: DUF4091 domain-containing protein [Armatimonadota bacterium]|nr:DUF4091 domain-containing protein [Armatimonadota bacterium]
MQRIFPSTPASDASRLELLAARNSRVSFQACVRNQGKQPIEVRLEVESDLEVSIRRVGYVPVKHHNTDTEESELDGVGHIPGFVPDPLFPENSVTAGPFESHAFWVTVNVPAGVSPGKRELAVQFSLTGQTSQTCQTEIDIRPLVIRPADDFPVAHWFYADALCDWYKVVPFEERFWQIAKPYMQDMVEHGGNCMYVPLFTPPTDGVKRSTQLVRVTEAGGQYQFDFSDVKRWVDLARECGATWFEWTHFFWQWGVKYALRIYRSNHADGSALLWPPETPATSETYRNFLAQFLPKFHDFLAAESLLDRSIFHVSDEPHGDEHLENYRKARAMLKDLAPWMKVADALSDIRFGLEGLTDMPIPSISVAKSFIEAGIPSCAYFCCGPRGKYLQRLMDTPLAKIAMSGWLFHKLRALGFLHWGYNYWHKSQTQELIDPFTEQSGLAWPGWAYGDTFVVYPGPDGPIDSIRWEVFAESLQDLALLRTAGIDPDDPLLAVLRGYNDFPKTETWVMEARKRLLFP